MTDDFANLRTETNWLIFALWVDVGGDVRPYQERMTRCEETADYLALTDLHRDVERALEEAEA